MLSQLQLQTAGEHQQHLAGKRHRDAKEEAAQRGGNGGSPGGGGKSRNGRGGWKGKRAR